MSTLSRLSRALPAGAASIALFGASSAALATQVTPTNLGISFNEGLQFDLNYPSGTASETSPQTTATTLAPGGSTAAFITDANTPTNIEGSRSFQAVSLNSMTGSATVLTGLTPHDVEKYNVGSTLNFQSQITNTTGTTQDYTLTFHIAATTLSVGGTQGSTTPVITAPKQTAPVGPGSNAGMNSEFIASVRSFAGVNSTLTAALSFQSGAASFLQFGDNAFQNATFATSGITSKTDPTNAAEFDDVLGPTDLVVDLGQLAAGQTENFDASIETALHGENCGQNTGENNFNACNTGVTTGTTEDPDIFTVDAEPVAPTNNPPPSPVPEPASLGLFGLGLAGLMRLRRRAT